MFGEALDAAPFPGILTVEPLWIELVAQPQRLVFLIQAGQIGLCRRREIKPFRSRSFFFQLIRAKISLARHGQITAAIPLFSPSWLVACQIL